MDKLIPPYRPIIVNKLHGLTGGGGLEVAKIRKEIKRILNALDEATFIHLTIIGNVTDPHYYTIRENE